MYESREKMRVDEIVDQVVGRSWLQGCPNICAATHFHARSSSRANVVPDVPEFRRLSILHLELPNVLTLPLLMLQRQQQHTHTEGCGIPHLHKRGRKSRGYSSMDTAVWHICHAKWNCSHTLLLLYIQYVLCWLECIMWWLEWPEICVHYPKSLIRFIKLEYSLDLCRCRCCEFVVW